MSDQNPPEASPSATSRRRSSFAGMMDFFAPRTSNSPPNGTPAHQGAMAHAAAQAQQRRLSITTVGLGSSPNSQPSASPFNTMRSRGQSISSAGSGSVEESPFDEGDGAPGSGQPTSPFARRVSFGARALRDVRTGSGSGGGGGNNANEGFNFAENMRARAERTSISTGPAVPNPSVHGRSKSVAVMEPPVKEMPAQPRKPDQFQERILKGDFYMD